MSSRAILSTNGTLTFWLDGHMDVLGRPLHKFSKTFLHTFALWWVMGDGSEFVYEKICGGEINHCVHNFQVFIELLSAP